MRGIKNKKACEEKKSKKTNKQKNQKCVISNISRLTNCLARQ
jgi:hypothetical protein